MQPSNQQIVQEIQDAQIARLRKDSPAYWGQQLLAHLINDRKGLPQEILDAHEAGVEASHFARLSPLLAPFAGERLWGLCLRLALEGRAADFGGIVTETIPLKQAGFELYQAATVVPPTVDENADIGGLAGTLTDRLARRLIDACARADASAALQGASLAISDGASASEIAILAESALSGLGDLASWGPAIPLEENISLPKPDLGSLPAWLGNYCAAVASALQVSEEIPLVAGLALASAGVCGASWIAGPQGQVEPALLWAAVSAGSGERKSQAFSRLLAPAYALKATRLKEYEAIKEAEKVELDVLEGRIAALKKRAIEDKSQSERDFALSEARKMAAELAARPRARLDLVLVGDDATPEALSEQLIASGRLAQISAEGAGVFAIAGGRYSDAAALETQLQSYGSDPLLSRSRAGSSTSSVAWARLSVGLAAQHDAVRRAAQDPTLTDRGLIARFLWFRAKDLAGSRLVFEGEPHVPGARDYQRAAHAILTTPQHPLFLERGREDVDFPLMRFDRAGANRLLDFARDVESRLLPGNDLADIIGWSNKMVGQAIRLAAVYCLSERRAWGIDGDRLLAPIEDAYVEAAIHLAEVSAAHTREICLSAPESLLFARRALEWIKKNHVKGTFQLSNLHNGIRRSNWEVERDTMPIVNILVRNNLIRRLLEIPTRKRGRPPVYYDVHPSIWAPGG